MVKSGLDIPGSPKKSYPWIFSVLLLVWAVYFPADRAVEALVRENLNTEGSLRIGVGIFRLTLVAEALLVAVTVMVMSRLSSPGIPADQTGLTIGPEGYRGGDSGSCLSLLTATVFLAAALRLIGLGKDLWLDEIYTLSSYARLPVLQVLGAFRNSNQHLFYSLLSNLSVDVFGESAWAMRLPAVIFGIAAIPALFYFARAVTGKKEACWAAALLAVSYHHIWFSQNARGWIGLVFFSLLGSGLFLRGLAGNRGGTWAAYAVVMVLGLFTHLNTLFVFMGHLSAYFLVFFRRQKEFWPLTVRIFLTALWIGVLSVQAYSFILPRMVRFYLEADLSKAGWKNPLELLNQFVLGTRVGFLGAGLVLLLLLVLAGFLSYLRQSPLVAAMIALPAAFNVLVLIALKTGGHPRILIYVLPLALVVAVRGAFVIGGFLAERFREEPAGRRIGRQVGTLLVAGLFSASLLSLVHYYRYPKQDFTGSLSFVREQMAPNDVAAAVHHAGSAYRLLYGPDLQFPLSVEELEELRDHQGDTWVIITLRHLLKRRKPVMYEYLKKEFTPVKVFPGTLGGGAVWVLRDREP